jgi:Phytochelatin synthase
MRAIRAGAIALILFVVAAIVALWFRIHPEENARYKSVATIEHDATFKDAALLAEAEHLPVAAAYLSRPYEYQANASFCGPTSAADVVHSLGKDATQLSVLDGTRIHPVLGMLPVGLTLDKEATLVARATGDPVTVYRGLDITAFRAFLAKANDPSERLIVNFHRGPLFGRGHGHFSPVLAYMPARDLVLIGDVNRKYGIYLVSSTRLLEAMNTVDFDAGKKRGLLVIGLPKPAG